MGKRAAPAPNGIVTGNSGRTVGIFRARVFIVFAGLVVLFGLAASGWYIWNHTSLLHQTASKMKVDYSRLTPAEAVKAAQEEVSGAQTTDDKQAAYTALGDAYRSSGQTAQSTAAYQQALTYTSNTSTSDETATIQVLERLSGEYEDAGDKANAVSTLQKLISALQASTISDKDFLLSRYQAELSYVQGGGV